MSRAVRAYIVGAGDAPGLGGISMAEYLGLDRVNIDGTKTGGSSYVVHVRHAADASGAGRCPVALITMAASHHAQYNKRAVPRDVVTIQDVVGSPMIADPLRHRLDCSVVSDGGCA